MFFKLYIIFLAAYIIYWKWQITSKIHTRTHTYIYLEFIPSYIYLLGDSFYLNEQYSCSYDLIVQPCELCNNNCSKKFYFCVRQNKYNMVCKYIYNMRQNNTKVNNDNFYFLVNWLKHNINTHTLFRHPLCTTPPVTQLNATTHNISQLYSFFLHFSPVSLCHVWDRSWCGAVKCVE